MLFLANVGCRGFSSAPAPAATARPTNTPAPTPTPLPRSVQDREDDVDGQQVHLMYVLPADGDDQNLDTNGSIATSLIAAQNWMASLADGRRLQIDAFQGEPDITFYQLQQSDREVNDFSTGEGGPIAIKEELETSGLMQTGKIYVVYYEGTADYACGATPTLPSSIAVLNLHGNYPDGVRCDTLPLGVSASSVDSWGILMIHEVVHALGFVPDCARNNSGHGHVVDDPADLMYDGPLTWQPSQLDAGNDDYFHHDIADCPDLADSPYLTH